VVVADQPGPGNELQQSRQVHGYDVAVMAGVVDVVVGDECIIGELPVFQNAVCGVEAGGLFEVSLVVLFTLGT
jgi:sensor domain CHASE-containing protein